MARITVVIINWNGLKYLKECLDALMKQSYKGFDAIMVDNGSTDGSADFVEKKYKKIKVIRNRKNLGVAEATNIGFRQAGGEYIVSLHNDAIADRDWLKTLVNSMDKAPKKVACIEGAVHHFGGVGVLNGSINVMVNNILDVFSDPRMKFYSGTCSMIIRNGLLGEYCDPDYFFYQEDVKMGWTLRLMGYDIIREPDAKVMHYGTVSASTPVIKKHFQFLSERNRLLNIFSMYSLETIAKLMPIFCFTLAFNILKDAAKTRWKLVPHMKAYLWVASHQRYLMKKRREVRSKRKVWDGEITRMMSSKLFQENSGLRGLNGLSSAYCRLVGVKCYD
jgi:GT2 family glycosyltransferase